MVVNLGPPDAGLFLSVPVGFSGQQWLASARPVQPESQKYFCTGVTLAKH
jgi:hypothetical protein